jgi:hypothetical protein
MCPDGATYLSTGCLFQDKDVIIIISLNVIFTQHEGGLIFQLYCGGLFYCWRKPEYLDKSTDL